MVHTWPTQAWYPLLQFLLWNNHLCDSSHTNTSPSIFSRTATPSSQTLGTPGLSCLQSRFQSQGHGVSIHKQYNTYISKWFKFCETFILFESPYTNSTILIFPNGSNFVKHLFYSSWILINGGRGTKCGHYSSHSLGYYSRQAWALGQILHWSKSLSNVAEYCYQIC